MQNWLGTGITERFIAFSMSHMVVLGTFLLSIILMYSFRHKIRQKSRSRLISRWTLALLLLVCELALNIWYVVQGVFQPKDTLPLELCSISLYLCIVMLIFRSHFIFQIAYFTGIGGAIQAMLTPVLAYPFPHLRFILFFLSHSLIILSALYMVWVESFRPTWKSILITMGFLNIALIPVSVVNMLTGGNYMFLARKPDTASLLDLLGPYPWYLLALEGVALLIFVLLYLPFAISGLRRKRKQLAASS